MNGFFWVSCGFSRGKPAKLAKSGQNWQGANWPSVTTQKVYIFAVVTFTPPRAKPSTTLTSSLLLIHLMLARHHLIFHLQEYYARVWRTGARLWWVDSVRALNSTKCGFFSKRLPVTRFSWGKKNARRLKIMKTKQRTTIKKQKPKIFVNSKLDVKTMKVPWKTVLLDGNLLEKKPHLVEFSARTESTHQDARQCVIHGHLFFG